VDQLKDFALGFGHSFGEVITSMIADSITFKETLLFS